MYALSKNIFVFCLRGSDVARAEHKLVIIFDCSVLKCEYGLVSRNSGRCDS